MLGWWEVSRALHVWSLLMLLSLQAMKQNNINSCPFEVSILGFVCRKIYSLLIVMSRTNCIIFNAYLIPIFEQLFVSFNYMLQILLSLCCTFWVLIIIVFFFTLSGVILILKRGHFNFKEDRQFVIWWVSNFRLLLTQ